MNADFERLAVIDLARHYGRRKALAQVNFTCGAGDIIGLLGPNGAGKSTLLNILATLISPSRGRVEYGDRTAAQGGAEVRGRIGMLGHDLFLYPELTARENLVFFARLYGLPDAEAVAQARLARAGLADRGDDLVLGFSRGMRQRVALERALLHDPRLVLLDEPAAGITGAEADRLVELIHGINQQAAVVVVDHDMNFVRMLGGSVTVLHQGAVLMEGATDAVMNNAKVREVYIGNRAK